MHSLASVFCSQATLRSGGGGPDDVVGVSPREDELSTPVNPALAASDDLTRTANIAVFEGQVLKWALTLHNIGPLPITACQVVATNHKGEYRVPVI